MSSDLDYVPAKRGRGRPRKHFPVDETERLVNICLQKYLQLNCTCIFYRCSAHILPPPPGTMHMSAVLIQLESIFVMY